MGPVRDEDACICFNYRADRVRQITRVLARNSGLTKDDGKSLPGAEDLDRMIPPSEVPKRLHYVCMTQYDKQFSLPIVILPESMENLLADMLAQANLRNLRIAETEKYAHVTYFFNGGIEKPFPGEDRVLVPSQKVATYDLAPEMSAAGIADAVIKAIGDPAFDLVVVNFANADMVGHSGKLEPTIQGVETIDACLGRIYQTLKQRGGSMLITADHGNAELMIDPVTGGPHTAHTTNPVPVILVSDDAGKYRLRAGRLAARHLSHSVGHARTGKAGTHDRRRPTGGNQLEPLTRKHLPGGTTAGKFEITKAKDGDYHFHLKAANGQIILTSQMYKEKSSARGEIEAVKKNASVDRRYEREEAHNGEHMFNLKAGNHQVIGTSQMYKSIEDREEGIASVRENAPEATVHNEAT